MQEFTTDRIVADRVPFMDKLDENLVLKLSEFCDANDEPDCDCLVKISHMAMAEIRRAYLP